MPDDIFSCNSQKWTELVSIGRLREMAGYEIHRPQGRQDLLFIYTLSGSGWIGRSRAPRKCGDAALFLPGVPQHYGIGDADHWELLWVHVQPPGRWRPWLNWQALEAEPEVMMSNGQTYDREIRHSFEQAVEWSRMPIKESEALALSCIEACLLWCHARTQNENSLPDERLRPALQQLTRHPEQLYLIADLAAKCGLSSSRFAHLFKQSTGTSPLSFQESLRMRMAADLLRNSGASIKEIAHRLGYEDPLYFSRRFRKAHNASPRDFRVKS